MDNRLIFLYRQCRSLAGRGVVTVADFWLYPFKQVVTVYRGETRIKGTQVLITVSQADQKSR